jgi:hypothetical protein
MPVQCLYSALFFFFFFVFFVYGKPYYVYQLLYMTDVTFKVQYIRLVT